MRKILLVTLGFPPRPGGGENYCYELCKQFPADQIVVLADEKLLTYGKIPETKFEIIYRGFYFTSKLIWPKWLKLLFLLPKIIKQHKPDILWSGEVIPTGLVVKIICKIYKLPYFITTHGADVLNPQTKIGWKKHWKTSLIKYVLKSAEFVTANTEYTRLLLSKLGLPRDQTEVVFPCATVVPPADSHITSENIKQIKQLKKDGYTILLGVNRLVRRKGIDMVLQSLPKVWEQRPKVAYVVVSDGPLANHLKELASKVDNFVDNRKRVVFTGFISDEEQKVLYELCDIFVMVPRNVAGLIEGFGIVYLIASHFGKPVIGTKMTGIPEAIRELYDQNYDEATGLLVENPKNKKEIAKKIIMLVKDRGLAAKLGANGKTWAKRFNWSEEATKIKSRLK